MSAEATGFRGAGNCGCMECSVSSRLREIIREKERIISDLRATLREVTDLMERWNFSREKDASRQRTTA